MRMGVAGSYYSRRVSGGAVRAEGGLGWHGTGGGTGCAAWLQVGGMVRTVAGVMVGASMGGSVRR